MLPNIRAHSLLVCTLAELLTDDLNETTGPTTLCRDLVVAGALLHDIAKTPCLNNTCDHAAAGADICINHGYPEVAEIVAQHVLLGEYLPEQLQKGQFTEIQIVYYADKRVCHDQVVSLEQRLQYILERYGRNDPHRHELIRHNFNRCIELERYLFRWLPYPPAALGQ
ncbi:MAG: metal-dependent phosphohydrolase [Desulfobulbus propionicus]|nr:MAG: metal-dependent phosphohydrolase [Desulfobulbus propionicus]